MPDKWMWIVGGPNGAGKSSVAAKFIGKQRIPSPTKLNADEVNVELRKLYPHLPIDTLNLRSAIVVDGLVNDCIALGMNFTIETVLTSDKYRKAVTDAKAKGYKVGLIYVSLYPPELSPQRVKIRAGKGGHDVEHAKALERYHRSHKQLTWFAAQADRLIVVDNSVGFSEPAVLLAYKLLRGDIVHEKPNYNPSVDAALAPLLDQPAPPARKPAAKAKRNHDPE